ncbi:hypothetical protein C8R45DRAFT_956071 [Mycena sanguinolenta]|nr:hypothetical protein C8R45DRAFT_1017529 [Mycena sanguinolenta]KAJ6515309.1 hypothetical protein C8R45DRAFT_956071 [Mycena sanguinolenta]
MSESITLPAALLKSCVADKGLTLDHLHKIIRIKKPRSKLPTSIDAAIEILEKAQVIVDWDVVTGMSALNTDDNKLEELIQSLVSQGYLTIPEEHVPSGPVVLHGKDKVRPERIKKNVATMTDSFAYSLREAWEPARTWKYIIHDPKIDTKINDPKLIVLDFTASDPDPISEENGDLVNMIRFHLPVHVYQLEPSNLDPGQLAAPEATTFAVLTMEVLKGLFISWEPTKCELPFAVWYSLPGYEFGDVEILRFQKGILNRKKPLDSATWMLGTDFRAHKLPLIGPANAKRIMLTFYPMEEPQPESTPTREPTPVTRSVSPEAASKEVQTPGAVYLLDKYGNRSSVQAMRSVDSDVRTGKSNVKGGRPISVLVEWVTDIEDIMRKHHNQRIPAERGRKKGPKFVQRDFELLFSRKFQWIESAQDAAEAIRKQRERLAGNNTKLQAFNKYLADNDPKKAMGVKSFAEAVQAFGEEKQSRDSDDDI